MSKVKAVSLAAVIVLIVSGVGLFFRLKEEELDGKNNANKFNRNAVASNGPECASIGM